MILGLELTVNFIPNSLGFPTLQKQIFVPPHRRVEEKSEDQRQMEQRFEDMYMAATGTVRGWGGGGGAITI